MRGVPELTPEIHIALLYHMWTRLLQCDKKQLIIYDD